MRRYKAKAYIIDKGSMIYFAVWASSLAKAREKAHKKLRRRSITNYLLFV